MKKIVLTLLVLTVFILHQDFWWWKDITPLVLGFLPIGLAYHVGFAILCSAMMAVLVKFAWPTDLEEVETKISSAESCEETR